MITLSPKDCRALFKTLSPEEQDYIYSDELSAFLEDAAKKEGLTEEQTEYLVVSAGYFILKAISSEDLASDISERAGVSLEVADRLSKILISHLRADIKKQPEAELYSTTSERAPAPVRLDLLQKNRVERIEKDEAKPTTPPVVIQPIPTAASKTEPAVAPSTSAPAVSKFEPQSHTLSPEPVVVPPPTAKPTPSPLAVDLSSLRSSATSTVSGAKPTPTPQTQTPPPVFIREEGEVKPIHIEDHIPTPTQNIVFNNKDQISAIEGENFGVTVKEKAGPATIEFGGSAESTLPPPLATAVLPPTPSENMYGSVIPQAPKPVINPTDVFESGLPVIPSQVVRPIPISPEKKSLWASFIESVSPIKKTRPPIPSAPPDQFAPPPPTVKNDTPPPPAATS